ncbi:hypothetical protein G7Y89_g986 [Cudoniella acicularis]|uniref:Peptidase M16 N-terminal domain-containing protein n=1 Tax=Cudoniella acicularis TaxID=354080 RepID=A0A8H4RW45_9HELO|nr:hypothetical protein G7Y89_g986 [Cudoniella acicularis]
MSTLSQTQTPGGFDNPLGEHKKGPDCERITDKFETPSLDERSYRVIRLPNQLEVLLVHDAITDKASAAMDVNTGNEDLPGMAHDVEHLLFMGTKKYPVENSYSQYLKAHSGSSNAYVGATSTNYYFEVGATTAGENAETSPLYGALDRFAQFFINPLFSSSTLDQELRAVDLENKKNLQNEPWGLHQLEKSLSNGPTFMEFYEKHYLADKMKLVILGREPLDVLEGWVADLFAGVRDKNFSQNAQEVELFETMDTIMTQLDANQAARDTAQNFNIAQTKRQARKEARRFGRYAGADNPFRKGTRFKSLFVPANNDVYNKQGSRDVFSKRDEHDPSMGKSPPTRLVSTPKPPNLEDNPASKDSARKPQLSSDAAELLDDKVKSHPSQASRIPLSAKGQKHPKNIGYYRRPVISEEEKALLQQYEKKALKHETFIIAEQVCQTIFNAWTKIPLLAPTAPEAFHSMVGDIYTPYLDTNFTHLLDIFPPGTGLSFITKEAALKIGEIASGLTNVVFRNVNTAELLAALLSPIRGNPIIATLGIASTFFFKHAQAAVIPSVTPASSAKATTDISLSTSSADISESTSGSSPGTGNSGSSSGAAGDSDIGTIFRQKAINLLISLYEVVVAGLIILTCQLLSQYLAFLWLYGFVRDASDNTWGVMVGLFIGGALLTSRTIRMGISAFNFEAPYVISGSFLAAAIWSIAYWKIENMPGITKPDVLILPSVAIAFALLEVAAKVVDASMNHQRKDQNGPSSYVPAGTSTGTTAGTRGASFGASYDEGFATNNATMASGEQGAGSGSESGFGNRAHVRSNANPGHSQQPLSVSAQNQNSPAVQGIDSETIVEGERDEFVNSTSSPFLAAPSRAHTR